MKLVSRLLDISSTDPDDARRRKLLNVLLVGCGAITLLAILATAISGVTGLEPPEQTALLYTVDLGLLAGILTIYLINRHWSGELAAVLFLLLVTGALALSDAPQQVVSGRTLFMFALPILMASVLLRPYASFATAGVVGVTINVIAVRADLLPDMFAVLGFFAIAMVSWLAARSLEHALRDLRAVNRELDQRVDERTRELAEALAENKAILEGIADGVIVFDNRGKATVANPAMARLLEQSPGEIRGRNVDELMGKEIGAANREQVRRLMGDKETSSPGLKFEWGEKTLSVSFAPVRDSLGRVTGTVAVFRDFTREAEIDRMKSAFVSMVSHELRTPLNVILGYADMLREGACGPLSKRQHNVVGRVMTNTRRLLSIVNDLLDQAQIEAGRLSLRIVPFTLDRLMEDVHSLTVEMARDKGLELTSDVAGQLPTTLHGDPQRLGQILVNLVSNAIKFTERGAVRVRAYRPDADHWALEVADTGRGIPAEAQPFIFEPFGRADDTATREHSGVGLGLSIVKQLATLMGGDVALDSEMGRGSTFTVLLPLTPSKEERA